MDQQFGFFTSENQEEIDAYWGVMRRIGSIGNGCSAFCVQFRDGTSHELHYHPYHDEIVYVAAGKIEQTIGDLTQILNVGDSAVIPRKVPHRAQPLETNTEVIVILDGEGFDYISVELSRINEA